MQAFLDEHDVDLRYVAELAVESGVRHRRSGEGCSF